MSNLTLRTVQDSYWDIFFVDKCGSNSTVNSTIDLPPFSLIRALLFGIPASFIIVITVVGNFLVLCFRAKVGKSQTTLLIWNLGLADFLVGIVVLPMGVTYVIARQWPFGYIMCKLWTACDVIFCTASIVTLCVISVDRYIGVTRPLRYKVIITKRRVTFTIIVIWVCAVGILLITERYEMPECYDNRICLVSNELQYVVHSVISAFFVPAGVTLVLYWRIYTLAKRRESGLRSGLMITLTGNFLNSVSTDGMRVHMGKDQVSHQRKVIAMHKKVAKTLGVVVTAFLACWLPFFTTYLIHYHCDCVKHIIMDVLSWMGYCNSMVNPIIYAFTVDEFKDSLKSIFTSHATACKSRARMRSITTVANNDNANRSRCNSVKNGKPGASKGQYGILGVPEAETSLTSCSARTSFASTICRSFRKLTWNRSEAETPIPGSEAEPIRLQDGEPMGLQQEDSLAGMSEDVIWSAKLYNVLIDSKVTEI